MQLAWMYLIQAHLTSSYLNVPATILTAEMASLLEYRRQP